MSCDRYEVLHKVVRIANCMAFDYPRSVKSILRYLVRALTLEGASFYLLDHRRKVFSHSIQASGPDLFLPCHRQPDEPSEGATLVGHRPIQAENLLHLPVYNRRHDYGVLSLRADPAIFLPEQCRDLLKAVCEQLASLAQHGMVAGEERRRVAQLTLLSELGRELNRAQTQRELLRVALRTLQRHVDAACVILRPLYGETLLDRCRIRLARPWRALRPVFLDLEEELSASVITDGRPVFRRKPTGARDPSTPLPPAMASVPLTFQARTLGTLTLFGEEDGNGIPLATDPEAKKLLAAIGSQIANALERVTSRERLTALSDENERKLRETTLLYRTSRAMHSTLRLNELIHLILSAAALPEGGGFERAMLFMVNERSGILQGMLGVTRKTAALVFPQQQGAMAWERPEFGEDIQSAQRRAHFCRQVMKQRLPLDARDNALSRAVFKERVILVPRPAAEPLSGAALAEDLSLSPFACVPLLGRDKPLGVLVVDNPETKKEITADRLRFLELFANQAGAAMENSMLVHRLETAHLDLRETQERLIQGEKMASLGEMAASVAHELRNPLVSIGGFAQRLNRITAADSREHEYAAIIARETRRMEEMLANILAFSKKQLLCVTACNVSEIIEEALALEADTLSRGSIRLVKEITHDLPLIQADEQKLRQVIINLISNARQVMSEGGILTVRTYSSSLRGDKAVTVEVEDTGGGIPPEVMRNIFNPFFTTKDEGTGLGLSISHRIVEHHHGEIEVQNREAGALFILRLPVGGISHLSVDKKRRFG
jgi:signal transduction histidine kinase